MGMTPSQVINHTVIGENRRSDKLWAKTFKANLNIFQQIHNRQLPVDRRCKQQHEISDEQLSYQETFHKATINK